MDEIGLDEALQLETEVWDALVAGDAGADRRLLADDFLGVYATGFGDRAEHAAQLRHGPTVAEFSLSEARVRTLAAGVVLLAYRADYRRHDAAELEAMFVTSIWCLRGQHWLNVFSQDTPVTDVRPP